MVHEGNVSVNFQPFQPCCNRSRLSENCATTQLRPSNHHRQALTRLQNKKFTWTNRYKVFDGQMKGILRGQGSCFSESGDTSTGARSKALCWRKTNAIASCQLNGEDVGRLISNRTTRVTRMRLILTFHAYPGRRYSVRSGSLTQNNISILLIAQVLSTSLHVRHKCIHVLLVTQANGLLTFASLSNLRAATFVKRKSFSPSLRRMTPVTSLKDLFR